jgi:hypothetical protein
MIGSKNIDEDQKSISAIVHLRNMFRKGKKTFGTGHIHQHCLSETARRQQGATTTVPVASVQQSTDTKCEAKCSGRYKRENDRRTQKKE